MYRSFPVRVFRSSRSGMGPARVRYMSQPTWATCDPETLSKANPCKLQNLVDGKWSFAKEYELVPDPMTGDPFVQAPLTCSEELGPFVESLASCPKSGLHNPLKNTDRYLMLGEVSHKAAIEMEKEMDFYVRCIMRTMPKSYIQAENEVKVTVAFLKNFSGDGVRFLAKGFHNPGDHSGQTSVAYRWPFGPVAIVAPFNFPLEIPVLQLMGALYMGNKPVIKSKSNVALVLEQYVRMLHACGLPETDIDLIHADGPVMGELLTTAPIRVTQFTGSSTVAEHLSKQLSGKVRIEDAGFDWKILGPDVQTLDYVAYQCDQDAYACSGQKCSAQSIIFAHENWAKAGLFQKLEELASRRNLADLTIGPVLSVTNQTMINHVQRLLEIDGAKLLFGGNPLTGHSIPAQYGAFQPTAIYVPLEEMLKPENFDEVVKEIFGPFQVITSFVEGDEDKVLEACERMSHHLTAAVVSNDIPFRHKILANTVNGTTYCGIRARTTGAPQNHWFGPGGDPRGAGIGTHEAINLVWGCHREVVYDDLPAGADWKAPPQS